jgi:hypothetical protein
LGEYSHDGSSGDDGSIERSKRDATRRLQELAQMASAAHIFAGFGATCDLCLELINGMRYGRKKSGACGITRARLFF